MSDSPGLSRLWEFLRRARAQHLAVDLIRSGITSPDDIIRDTDKLVLAGVAQHDIEALLAAIPRREEQPSRGRMDLPVLVEGPKRASFTLALQAAQRNNRKRSLDLLDQDINSRSTKPAMDSRLKTYRALAAAWEVEPFPMSVESIRCIGASLKAGFYRSAQLYYQSAIDYQLRCLKEPVHPLLRSTVRDAVRSIRRGLGPAGLKEGFDPFQLANVIDVQDDSPFNFNTDSHVADVILLGCWFMLRELEMAGASRHHLSLEGNEVHLLIPVHKTATSGSLTVRVLRCACGSVLNRVCPWHCAERHLVRLMGHDRTSRRSDTPLMPDPENRIIAKHVFVERLRSVLQAAGVAAQRQDSDGRTLERFGGHAMRVSGALMLASAGTPIHLIQLLGRWSSSAVERYVQFALLAVVPDIPRQILQGETPQTHGGQVVPPTPTMVQAPSTPAARATRQASEQPQMISPPFPEVDARFDSLQAEIASIKTALKKPDANLIIRHHSSVVHESVIDEQANHPSVWQTRCGWQYGIALFYRVPCIQEHMRSCRKCFPDRVEPTGNEDPEGDSSASSDSSSESSESEGG